jgi:hypothetical protein
VGLGEVRITNRYDPFRGTSKEKTARKYGVAGVNVFARKGKQATGVTAGRARPAVRSLPSDPEVVGTGDEAAMAAAAGGLVAAVATAGACVGPLVAILLGVGGLGWLTRYADLRVPASIATGTLLAFGFYQVYRRPRAEGCGVKRSSKKRVAVGLLWTATVVAVAVNLFEYLVFPHLG